MNTVEKGDQLELSFLRYLQAQKDRGELVFGAYPPDLCKITHRKGYYCPDRKHNVKFDIVIEFYRTGSTSPHIYVVFECKNYSGSIPVEDVNNFSSDIFSVFRHAGRGVMVISTRLQSGAFNSAKSKKLGIIKFNEDGLEIIAERNGGFSAENGFLKSQFLNIEDNTKPLKFSSYYNGKFFSSISGFLNAIEPSLPSDESHVGGQNTITAPYIPNADILKIAESVLQKVGYRDGEVDLNKMCFDLSIDIQFSNKRKRDSYGNEILGHANFERKTILVNQHENKHRERFTIAHEIGHFCLDHGRYLRFESIIENDIFKDSEEESKFNYDRLEIQANKFSSYILMPDTAFRMKVREIRKTLDIRDRGRGIYVDDQPCNRQPYLELISRLSSHFNVSKQAAELRLKDTNTVTDWRTNKDMPSISDVLSSANRTMGAG